MTFGNHTKGQHLNEYLVTSGPRKMVLNVPKGRVIYSQGDPADSVYYIQKGRVKISVTSPHGKEATLALQSQGGFIGEECIAPSHPLRLATAAAIQPCTVLSIDSKETEANTPQTNQETLAEMIGTTRSRVSFFMNRFRKMGYIQYNGCNGGVNGEVKVHRSLFNVLLND
jgi:CRP-like cAMP-binding protein